MIRSNLNETASRRMRVCHKQKSSSSMIMMMTFLYFTLAVIAGTAFYGSAIQKITSEYLYDGKLKPPEAHNKNTISIYTVPGK